MLFLTAFYSFYLFIFFVSIRIQIRFPIDITYECSVAHTQNNPTNCKIAYLHKRWVALEDTIYISPLGYLSYRDARSVLSARNEW
jgi:hypothetical protein